MKIILDEKEQSVINRVDEDIKERGNDIPLYVNQYNTKYMLDFTVVDLAKANLFISSVLGRSYPETVKEIEDKLGIHITALRYDTDVEDVKNVLREALARLENM